MNILYMVMVALTALPIIVGGLMGLKRGLNRSVLRLVIVVASLVAAWLLREKLIAAIMDADISALVPDAGGQTIRAIIESSFSGDQAKLAELVIPIVEILVGIIAFLLSFIVLKFVSLIIFWVLKIFVRPGAQKRRLFGALVGVAQGLVVAYFICVPLNGLLGTVDALSEIEISTETVAVAPAENVSAMSEELFVKGVVATATAADQNDNGEKDGADNGGVSDSQSSSSNPFKDVCDSLGITEYKASAISGLYDAVSFNVYDALTTVKDKNGNKVTLSVQVDAIVAAVKVANSAQKLGNIDFSDGLNDETIQQIKETLDEIENIKNEMSSDARAALTEMITVAVGSFGGDEDSLDFSNLNLDEVNFTAAGEAIEEAYNLQKVLEDETATEDDVKEKAQAVIEKVAESNLASAAADMGIDLSGLLETEEDKDGVNQTIDDLTGDVIDEQTAEALKKILGVGDYANIGGNGDLPINGEDGSDGGVSNLPSDLLPNSGENAA